MSLIDGRLFGEGESLSLDFFPNSLFNRILGAVFRHCAVFRSGLHSAYATPLQLCHGKVHLSPVGLALLTMEYGNDSFLCLLISTMVCRFQTGCQVFPEISVSVASKIAASPLAVIQAVAEYMSC